jgi:hypothetical protein
MPRPKWSGWGALERLPRQRIYIDRGYCLQDYKTIPTVGVDYLSIFLKEILVYCPVLDAVVPLVEWSGSEIVRLGSWVRFPPRGPVRPLLYILALSNKSLYDN